MVWRVGDRYLAGFNWELRFVWLVSGYLLGSLSVVCVLFSRYDHELRSSSDPFPIIYTCLHSPPKASSPLLLLLLPPPPHPCPPITIPSAPPLNSQTMAHPVLPFRDINLHASPSHYAFTSPSSPDAPTLIVERPTGDLRLHDGNLSGAKRISSIAGILGIIKLKLGEELSASLGFAVLVIADGMQTNISL